MRLLLPLFFEVLLAELIFLGDEPNSIWQAAKLLMISAVSLQFNASETILGFLSSDEDVSRTLFIFCRFVQCTTVPTFAEMPSV